MEIALGLAGVAAGLAPLAQYFCSRSDEELLQACLVPAPGAVVALWPVPGADGRRLAVRWTPGRRPDLPPVCIPNGLGATLITIGALHDLLEARGYAVLSYDRSGVGLSDPRPSGAEPAGADEVVADMKAVMDAHVPVGGRRPWILVGPSAGSIIGQCYAAAHPQDVVGFVNVDGFPYPFEAKRKKFLQAALVYKCLAAVIWTGLMRPGLRFASKQLQPLATPTFPLEVVRAQMNQRNFFASLGQEMTTMMNCAASAKQSWGAGFDIAALPPKDFESLVNAEPAACGDVVAAGSLEWVDKPRAKAEIGDKWAPREESQAVVAAMLRNTGEPLPPLPRLWRQLVVRVMTARNYDFGAASSFYEPVMQSWSAAEHNMHALLARDGRRLVFPERSHTDMFFALTPVIAQQVDEVAAALAAGK